MATPNGTKFPLRAVQAQPKQALQVGSPRKSTMNHSGFFVQDGFLMPDLRRNTLDVTCRVEIAAAVQTHWIFPTPNMGAGVFRRDAEAFIHTRHDAHSFFIRVTDNSGRRFDGTFDLTGGEEVHEVVADACGFTTLSLMTDDYRAI